MRARHGAPLCVLALSCLVSARHHEPIDVHPIPTCCFVQPPFDSTKPTLLNQMLEMNRSFEAQYLMLLKKILHDSPRDKRRWRLYSQGGVTLLRPTRGREPMRTLRSILVVELEDATEVTWLGGHYRWNATTLWTDERVCGCDPAGEVFFEQRAGEAARCWDDSGKIVGCETVSIPKKPEVSGSGAVMQALSF